jgi:hypothetical protein
VIEEFPAQWLDLAYNTGDQIDSMVTPHHFPFFLPPLALLLLMLLLFS